MSIFGKKKDRQPLPLVVRAPETGGRPKHQYDMRAALAKALLLFMLSFGPANGFLTAFDMEYNKLLCAVVLLGLSLFMGFLYETANKRLTNTAMFLVFGVYVYIAVTEFRFLNSGAYAVINRMYEAAREYLDITEGNEYSLEIQSTYLAVTAIAIFVGVVNIILLSIRTQYKAGFFGTFMRTFLLYPIPFYLDRIPDRLSAFLILAGYVTLLIVQCSDRKRHISEQIRRALPIGAALSAAVILVLGALVPQSGYRLTVPKNQIKEASEEQISLVAQYGLLALLPGSTTGGGVSGGKLPDSAANMPRNKTDLIVHYAPYSMAPVYLKAFAGVDYTGDRWLDVRMVLPKDGAMLEDGFNRRDWFAQNPEVQGRGVMEVINVDANADYEYQPYYAENVAVVTEDSSTYVYYPPVKNVEILCASPDERYLQVPSICFQAVENACREAGLSGSPEEIAEQIITYFRENYTYTLRPGFYFGKMDFISYFLERNRKGYCSHFASAATMLFRYMGIPARYVEGYAFSYADMALDGTLIEGNYGDYYSGYAPLGETAPVEMEVSDAQAHGWVEIYIDGKGWLVVDPTPPAREEEAVGGFWENFGLRAELETGEGQEESRLSSYLESVLEGSDIWLLAAGLAAALFFLGKKIVQKRRERELPPRERVQLEYGRLTGKLAERHADFAALTTPAQELQWIREVCGVEISGEFVERLYRIFFSPECGQDGEELCRELIRIRRKAR